MLTILAFLQQPLLDTVSTGTGTNLSLLKH